MVTPCAICGCESAQGSTAHAVRVALAGDDLDNALALGLLEVAICNHCDPACTTALLTAREARVRALAARERFHMRQARLAKRRQERNQRRAATAPVIGDPPTPAPPLPAAAAAALARAKAKAAGR